MSFIEWAYGIAQTHPDLANATIHIEDEEWLEVLFPSGKVVRFRPAMIIDRSAPLDVQEDQLRRVFTISMQRAAEEEEREKNDDAGAASRSRPSAMEPSAMEPAESPDLPYSRDAGGRDSDTRDAGGRSSDIGRSSDMGRDSSIRNPDTHNSDVNRGATGFAQFAKSFFKRRDDSGAGALGRFLNPATDEHVDAQHPSGAFIYNHTPDYLDSLWGASPNITVPTIRLASTVVNLRRKREESPIFVPLTDQIALIASRVTADGSEPIYQSEIGTRPPAAFLGESLENMREVMERFSEEHTHTITTIGGCRCVVFHSPVPWECPLMADVEWALTETENFQRERPNALLLFVPVTNTTLLAVSSDEPNLHGLFAHLLRQRKRAELIYPLPHIVTNDGWSEWIPFPDHPASTVLEELRHFYRAKIDDAVRNWYAFNSPGTACAPYQTMIWKSDEVLSVAFVDERISAITLPKTDLVGFRTAAASMPWAAAVDGEVIVRRHDAEAIWPDFHLQSRTWPPRYEISRFPDVEAFERLKRAAAESY